MCQIPNKINYDLMCFLCRDSYIPIFIQNGYDLRNNGIVKIYHKTFLLVYITYVGKKHK